MFLRDRQADATGAIPPGRREARHELPARRREQSSPGAGSSSPYCIAAGRRALRLCPAQDRWHREDVGRSGALIRGRRRSRATLGPATGDLVLLPDPGFVSEPGSLSRQARCVCPARSLPRWQWKFFKMLDRPLRLSVMARPGGELAVTQTVRSSRLSVCLAMLTLELFPQPLAEIDQTPAHDTVDGRGSDRSRWRPPTPRDGLRSAEAPAQASLRSTRPSGPAALNRSTQSRMICRPTSPIRAASLRLLLRHRRSSPATTTDVLCFASCVRRASRRRSAPVKVGPKRYRCCHGEHPAVRHGESHQPRVGQAL